eukprot:XP_003727854.1 PREDICTED: galanin receptor type 1-like [Strongylocentrotus purpuratus]
MDADWQNISRNDAWVWAPVSWEWWVIVQLVLAIIGILGNLLVMLVIFWPGRRRCATDILIGALAMADFLTSIFIIPHPHSIAVIVIWIAAFIINIGSLYALFVTEDRQCVLSLPVAFHRFLGVCLFILKYVMPVVIMVTSHAWTIYSLRQRQVSALRQVQSRVLQTLLIVVITFIICWTPDQFGFLVFNLGIVPFTHLFSPLYRCFVILAFANSCVNPFIYAARMPRFRKALKDLFWIKGTPRGEGNPSVFAIDGEGKSDVKEIP